MKSYLCWWFLPSLCSFVVGFDRLDKIALQEVTKNMNWILSLYSFTVHLIFECIFRTTYDNVYFIFSIRLTNMNELLAWTRQIDFNTLPHFQSGQFHRLLCYIFFFRKDQLIISPIVIAILYLTHVLETKCKRLIEWERLNIKLMFFWLKS